MAPLSQLVHAWAPEVPGAKTDPSGFERDLAHLLLEDMVKCRLYETGPLVNGHAIRAPGYHARRSSRFSRSVSSARAPLKRRQLAGGGLLHLEPESCS